jgi:phage tail-like protein
MVWTAFGRHAGTFVMMVAVLAVGAPAALAQERITAARFSITIDGYEIASFSELAGITTEVEPVENSPGRGRVRGLVQLSRRLGHDDSLAAWHELVILGDIAAARRTVQLVAYNSAGQPVLRYHLESAWPSRLEIAKFKAGHAEPLMETVTIVCERIQRVSASSNE